MIQKIHRIGVLTSGGDAPGMNAAIRAVTRSALAQQWEVIGVRRGYAGLMDGEFSPMTARSVGGIIQQGGTILGSARSLEFHTDEGRKTALRHLAQQGIDALVIIGGNGSQSGAHALHQMGFPVAGVASTIDNDLVGSDITVGVDTALNIALEAIDRLKVTASSHERAFLVEVMGRKCGYLALMAGIAGGAEAVVVPEVETTPRQVEEVILESYERGKSHAIVVVAEGATCSVTELTRYFASQEHLVGFDLRAMTLGHIQRGGAPGAFDRILATRLGYGAVEALAKGEYGVLAGSLGGEIKTTPLAEIIGKTKQPDPRLFKMAQVLAK
ncbi:MAG TPA: 6-phosphofructokinase [Aggregatilineales bacterium]|nr:6-phosphofructokinase [Aggregatilineales bacterium]